MAKEKKGNSSTDEQANTQQQAATEQPAAGEDASTNVLMVDLVPHTGTDNHPQLGETLINFDQYVIHLTSPQIRERTGKAFIEIGYVGKQPNAAMNWLPVGNTFPRDIQEGIELAVQQKLALLPNAHERDKQLAAAGQTRKVGKPLSEKVMNAAPPEGMAAGDTDTAGSDENI